MPGRLLRRLLSLLLLTSLLGVAGAWAADSRVKFNLPSDEFPKAILEFYHQSKIEVLFLANDTLSQIKTQPVMGELEPREALERMLKGTGLTFRFVTDHSVTIKQLQVAKAPPPPPPPKAPPQSVHHIGVCGADGGAQSVGRGDRHRVAHSRRHRCDVAVGLCHASRISRRLPSRRCRIRYISCPFVSLDAPREDLALNNNYQLGIRHQPARPRCRRHARTR